jgi:hypothetical protein
MCSKKRNVCTVEMKPLQQTATVDLERQARMLGEEVGHA